MTNLDTILKNRDITLPTNIHVVKTMVFPVVMYGWALKKAEHRRIGAFQLWCWRIILRVSWTARRSNQSILEKTNNEYSLERLMLKLKLQYFCYLLWALENNPDSGKDWGQEEKGVTDNGMVWWSLQLSIDDFEQNMGDSEGQGILAPCSSWDRRVGHDWVNEKHINKKKSQTWEDKYCMIPLKKDI